MSTIKIGLFIFTALLAICMGTLSNVLQLPVVDFINFKYLPTPFPILTETVIYCGTIFSVILNQTVIIYRYRPSAKLIFAYFQTSVIIISIIYSIAAILNLLISYPSNYYMFDCLPLIKNNKFVECLQDPSNSSFHALFNIPIIITTSVFITDSIVLCKMYDRLMPMLASFSFKVPWLICIIFTEIKLGSDFIIVFASLIISSLCLATSRLFQ
eukprot:NODE_402_length_9320_cov_0.440252.p5 type:complete len:213 gc:universal NODE_402_length_9320_cov_0.440252:4477-3839(-)